ncbi:MAG: cyclase family protein [Gammaproteobacteria bacterium]|nr:cyclase family protein [Gammaproteobacteria bacterium]
MNLVELIAGVHRIRVDLKHPIDISIPLVFDGDQPNFFGAPHASKSSLQAGEFIGDTTRGGSCNVDEYKLVPHCNGTHTECIGHIVHDNVFVPEVMTTSFLPATLITVAPMTFARTKESSLPNPEPTNRMVTAFAINQALQEFPDESMYRALIIRTLPNSEKKPIAEYHADDPPPFLSMEAANRLVELDVEHLLVDIPSIDRMNDDGRLTAHHIFWELPPYARDRASATRGHCTITEMIYVPDFVPDGYYLLNLQLPPFMADAAPSRPILYQAQSI